MPEPQAYSHPKTSQRIFEILTAEDIRQAKILDVGAGEGYFARMLGDYLERECGVAPADVLSACDLCPEHFKYDAIPCERADANARLPYDDNSFDAVCSIEVIEHVENHFHLLREFRRVAKPGGRVIVTTPNVLNINSRLRMLHSGFAALCNPVPLHADNPLGGHIHPVGYYHLAYLFHYLGFDPVRLHIDRMKRSALALSLLLYLPIAVGHWFFKRRVIRKDPDIYVENEHLLRQVNSLGILTARTIIVEGIKAR